MLGCLYELHKNSIDLPEVRTWLEDYIPTNRWKIFRHFYAEDGYVIWFRFESDAMMFGLAHDKTPKNGARVFISMITRFSLIATAVLMIIWMFIWSKIGYVMIRPFRPTWRNLEPDMDDFAEEKFDMLEPLGLKFEEWHHRSVGEDL